MTRTNGLFLRLATIVGSHTTVDLFAAIVGPLIGVLQIRCELTPQQTAWLPCLGLLSSGLTQPISSLLYIKVNHYGTYFEVYWIYSALQFGLFIKLWR